MEKKKPQPDATVTDLDPVESSSALPAVDTDPRIVAPHDSLQSLRPIDTADDSDTMPAPAPASPGSTQLLEDDEDGVPTLDKLPRVPTNEKPLADAPALRTRSSQGNKKAPLLEASSAIAPRKARKKVVGREDQFEASMKSLDEVQPVARPSLLKLGRINVSAFDVGLIVAALIAVAVIAWFFF